MSDTHPRPWSDNPNAPKIPYDLYYAEKAYFAGTLIGAILYGILVVLFFRCVTLLLNPINPRREGIKWGLVSYTTTMFAFATVLTGMGIQIGSISFVDNREFPGVEGLLPPGPLGYQDLIRPEAITIIPNLMFFLNNWLADCLLLYRCYVVYSMKLWVIAFPCLMYIASIAMGTMTFIRRSSRPGTSIWNSVTFNFAVPYLSISISLNVLLTLMIVGRLVLHSRNVRNAMGSQEGVGGWYKTTVTMLVESSALYAVSSLLVIGWGGTGVVNAFIPILCQTQVIASLFIIKRVANRSVLTSRAIITGRASSLSLRNRAGSAGGGETPYGGYPMGSMDGCGKIPGELEFRVDTMTDPHQDGKV